MLLYQTLAFTMNGKTKTKSNKYNKFKISAPTWNEELESLDGSYPVSAILDSFEYIIKKHETVTDNPLIMIHVNKIEYRITFKIKTGYCLELLMRETMKLLGSTKSKITKDKIGENSPHLEITEVVLIQFNTVNKDYQED